MEFDCHQNRCRNKIAQGNATLAGAVYGIYNNGKLVDKYTTDQNGSFTTSYYVCGDNWTLKEIEPSEGYLLDETEYHIGAEAKIIQSKTTQFQWVLLKMS